MKITQSELVSTDPYWMSFDTHNFLNLISINHEVLKNFKNQKQYTKKAILNWRPFHLPGVRRQK